MIDHTKVKLGKLAVRHDPRTLQMAKYVKAQLAPPPSAYDWTKNVRANWGMMANDKIGDCTCAAAGHLIMEWTANAGRMFTPSLQDIIKAYAAITGYDPKTGNHDNGAVELDVLNYWRRTGIAAHKIAAFVSLEPSNYTHIMDAVYTFGGCYIGVQLPLSAQGQEVWAVPPQGTSGPGAPGSWGGHAVPVVSYDPRGLTVVTWGKLLRMTWGFWQAYCDEAYGILSIDFLTQGKAPNGFDLKTLRADLAEL
jgi:hypothetical protein